MSFQPTRLTYLKPEAKKELLVRQLKRHKGNVTAIADELAMSRVHIHRVMRQFRLDAHDYRSAR